MRSTVLRIALLAAAFPAAALAQPRLTGVTVYGANAAGGQGTVEVWNTVNDGLANVFLSTTATPSQSADYLNPNVTLNHGLNASATYTFYLRTQQAFNTGYYGVNLLFDDATTPGITAFTQFNCVGCTGAAAAAGGNTPNGVAGGSEVVVGGRRITFRSFNFRQAADDRVGLFAPTPGGGADYAGVLQFDVNPVAAPTVTPEPGSLALMGFGLAGAAAAVRRRRTAAR